MQKITLIFFLFFAKILLNYCVQSQSCGVPKIGQGNVIGGSFADQGQFPWYAAVMRIVDGNPIFNCGGTLFSNKHILTAAHCVLDKRVDLPVLSRDTLIILGGHDLNAKFENGRQTISPIKTHIHPDWNQWTQNYDADLAIFELEFPVAFTNFIQPICLWESQIDPSATLGYVVGYGKSEDQTKRHENIPKTIELQIHTQEKCFLSNPTLTKISSSRTFCGGSANGTGVCSGDSGGGFMIKSNDAFYLRGIVSSSLVKDFSCDVDNYSVFTNVLKFKDWILNFIKEQKKFVEVTTQTSKPLTVPKTSSKDNSECGIMSSSSGLIQKGKFSSTTEFPWMASIVDYVDAKGINSSGSLISHKHVITRGRVISYWDKNQAKYVPYQLYRLKIYLGSLQHVSDQNAFKTQEIILHPNLKEVDEGEINSIGIITLSASVEFNDFIRPVCLWTFGDDLNLIKNLPLYAVGYGRDENGILTNIRKHAKVTLADQNYCEKKHSNIKNVFRETKTFCVVGDANESPCARDECLFVKFNEKWFLRGIMAWMLFFLDESCIFGEPYVYEDISQNVQWIQNQIHI